MPLLRVLLTFIVTFATLQAGAQSERSERWSMNWKEENGDTQKAMVGITIIEEDGNNLVALDWKLPWKDATEVEEASKSGEPVKLQVRKRPNGMHAYLISSKATLKIKTSDGTITVVYSLQKSSSELLRLDPSCKKADLKIKETSDISSQFPAALYCRAPKGSDQPTEIVFSSLSDSDWQGTDAFEIAGKGERYKTFSFGDESALKNFKLNWGTGDQRVSYVVQFPPKSPPNPPVPTPSANYEVGVSYVTGEFRSDPDKAKFGGLVGSGQMNYKKASNFWYAGGGAQLFLASTAKEERGSSNASAARAWLGLEQKASGLFFREDVGLIYRWLDLPGLQINANFQAPRLSFETGSSLMLKVEYATTASGGSYTEMRGSITYALPRFSFLSKGRVGLSYYTVKAVSGDITADGKWYSLDFSAGF